MTRPVDGGKPGDHSAAEPRGVYSRQQLAEPDDSVPRNVFVENVEDDSSGGNCLDKRARLNASYVPQRVNALRHGPDVVVVVVVVASVRAGQWLHDRGRSQQAKKLPLHPVRVLVTSHRDR